MYGKLDNKMNHDDGVILSDRAWKRAEEERLAMGSDPDPFWPTTRRFSEEYKAGVRLECLKVASSRASDTAPVEAVLGLASVYADFVLDEDDAEDALMERLSTIADVCRDAGV